MSYKDELKKILNRQLQPETSVRFADLKEGDILVVRPEIWSEKRPVRCGLDKNMEKVIPEEISFSLDKFSEGYVYANNWAWSLDMLQYGEWYESVDLV